MHMTNGKKIKSLIGIFAVIVSYAGLLASLSLSGCGGGGQGEAPRLTSAPLASTSVADQTPPTVSLTSPSNGATGVALNFSVSATFSQPMTNSSLNDVTFVLAPTTGGPAVSGTVNVSGNTATFTPAASLAVSTQYAATITTAAKNAAGIALAANFTWSFVTGVAPDTTPPSVSATSPANAAIGIALNTSVSASFSKAMTNSTLSSGSFSLSTTSSGAAVSGTVNVSGNTATFTPAASLASSTQYTATIAAGVTDAAGNPLPANFTWSFTTGAAPDTTPPTVSATSPADAATSVPVNSSISATFSKAMTNSTLSTASFSVGPTSSGTTIIGTVNVIGNTATFTPLVSLAGSTPYTATITTTAKDAAGNALATDFAWSFTTVQSTPPNAAILDWDRAASPNVIGYRIYYGLAPGTYFLPLGQGLNVGNVLTSIITGLSSGTRYYFAVTAIDTLGNESNFSNEVFKDIP